MEDAILSVLKERGEIPQKELAEVLDISQSQLIRCLRHLEKEGKIKRMPTTTKYEYDGKEGVALGYLITLNDAETDVSVNTRKLLKQVDVVLGEFLLPLTSIEKLRDSAREIAQMVAHRYAYPLETKAKAVVKLAIDKNKYGVHVDIKSREEIRVLKDYRSITGIRPVISVTEVIENQVRLVACVYGFDAEEILDTAIEYAEAVKGLSGSPVTVGGAVIYLAAKMAGIKLTQKEIGNVLNIYAVSIRSKLKEVMEVV